MSRASKPVHFLTMLAGAAAASLAALPAGVAAGPTVCLPPNGGVPAQPGPPDWWSASPPPPIDDPRWRGSFGVGHNQDNMQFRALYHAVGAQNFVLLSWHIKTDPGANASTGDILFAGFHHPGTNKTSVLTFKWTAPLAAGTTVAVKALKLFERTGSTGPFIEGTLPALIDTQAVITATCNGVDPPTCTNWSIRARIPMGAGGIDLPNDFRMWYELERTSISGGTTLVDTYKWPDTVTGDAVDSDPSPTIPASATDIPEWALVRVAVSPLCVNGVELRIEKIWANSAGNSEISVSAQNTFHAEPQNNSSGALARSSIKARFRIANWGSSVGDSPEWIDVPGVDAGSNCAAAIDTGAGSVPITPPPPGYWDIAQCKWTLTAGERCAYRPDLFPGCTVPPSGPRYRHQCILVNLSANGGAPVQFARDSAWNNFNIGPASRIERKARLDARGLPALVGGGAQRDLYVYVEAVNMPASIAPDPEGEQPRGEDLSKLSGGFVAGAARERLAQAPIRPGRIGSKEAEVLKALVAAGDLTYDDLKKVMPTYHVHVWHDTGETTTKNGAPAKVIRPQPSFGLFAYHDGKLFGWNHSLKGSTVETLGPNFYRVKVATNSFVDVDIAIETSPGPGDEKLPLWLYIILAILALVIGFLILRRRSATP